jgi:glycosyltransferase involved in cell wall biosynthesis
MKIIMVNKFFFNKGGSERVYFAQSILLEKAGYQVIPFAMRDARNLHSPYDHFFVQNIDYFKEKSLMGKISSGIKVLYSWEAARKIKELIKKTRPDLMHLHLFQHQLSPSIIWAAKQFDLPIVYTVHDLKPVCPVYTMLHQGEICERCQNHNYFHCLIKKCNKGSIAGSLILTLEMYLHHFIRSYDKIDVFITPSKFMKSKMVENSFAADKIKVLPNFINPDDYQPSNENADYFLYMGRLSPEKGLMTLLKAMKWVQKSILMIAGTGPEEMTIKQFLTNHKINNVRLLGYQPLEKLKGVISNAKFVVVPSVCYENCPMAVLEAFASGKPVIASSIGGLPELIKDGENGLLFEAKNVMELAEKINFLLSSPDLLNDMGRQARKDIELFLLLRFIWRK